MRTIVGRVVRSVRVALSVRRCRECGAWHATLPCRSVAADCDCCRSIATSLDSGRSMGRWWLAIACIVAAEALGVALNLHVYNGLNAGVAGNVSDHCIGFEWRGAPGWFAESCDRL